MPLGTDRIFVSLVPVSYPLTSVLHHTTSLCETTTKAAQRTGPCQKLKRRDCHDQAQRERVPYTKGDVAAGAKQGWEASAMAEHASARRAPQQERTRTRRRLLLQDSSNFSIYRHPARTGECSPPLSTEQGGPAPLMIIR
jgi:hypothetical protein